METYNPQVMDVSAIELPSGLVELTEAMAANVHAVWAAGRIAEGWKYGKERDDRLKLHPCLIPYDELSDEEKEYDRATAVSTLKLLIALGYRIDKV